MRGVRNRMGQTMTPMTARNLWELYRSTALPHEMAEDEVERARLCFLGGMAAVVELLREKAGEGDARAVLQIIIQAAASLRTMRTEVPPGHY